MASDDHGAMGDIPSSLRRSTQCVAERRLRGQIYNSGCQSSAFRHSILPAVLTLHPQHVSASHLAGSSSHELVCSRPARRGPIDGRVRFLQCAIRTTMPEPSCSITVQRHPLPRRPRTLHLERHPQIDIGTRQHSPAQRRQDVAHLSGQPIRGLRCSAS